MKNINKEFDDTDYWQAIMLFGLNVATYKPALAKCILEAAAQKKSTFEWDDLSPTFGKRPNVLSPWLIQSLSEFGTQTSKSIDEILFA